MVLVSGLLIGSPEKAIIALSLRFSRGFAPRRVRKSRKVQNLKKPVLRSRSPASWHRPVSSPSGRAPTWEDVGAVQHRPGPRRGHDPHPGRAGLPGSGGPGRRPAGVRGLGAGPPAGSAGRLPAGRPAAGRTRLQAVSRRGRCAMTGDDQGQKPERINRRRLALNLLATPLFFALFMLLPAGTWAWERGWLFILVFLALSVLAAWYIWRVNPELLAARVNPHRGTKS